MPDRKRAKSFLAKLRQRAFKVTGFRLRVLHRTFVCLLVVAAGVILSVLYIDAQNSRESSRDDVISDQRTPEELFVEVSQVQVGFANKPPLARIDILKSKAEAGEKLARSGGEYAERAIDQLVQLYGGLCSNQDFAGIDSRKSYRRLFEIRQRAFEAGNHDRVAAADLVRAIAATNRLAHFSEKMDFQFAADAVLSLNGKRLVDEVLLKSLFDDVIEIHNTSYDQESTSILLSMLGDKFIGSPNSEIANLGLDLKDHTRYATYYAAEKDPTHASAEEKVQFYEQLFSVIQQSPPQSLKTYQLVIRLLDKLINQSDTALARSLTKRLERTISVVSPELKTEVDQSVQRIKTRISIIGETLDLSGTKANGVPLRLPNDKSTYLLFWRFGEKESVDRLREFVDSERFDSWETNVVVACVSSLIEQQLSDAEVILGKSTVLSNETAHRLAKDIGIDFTPYLVYLDKDGKVIRLGVESN